MKTTIIKLLLIALIVIQVLAPILEMAIFGYDDIAAILSDVYKNGIIVILCAAIFHLYGLIDKED